ncbi:MAG: PQQ-dependent sugar dehydrogenase [Acidobacteria bacterium]|nr:PQQ-dependent sugar dehydrogenase [Acidobacteriota bacterium]
MKCVVLLAGLLLTAGCGGGQSSAPPPTTPDPVLRLSPVVSGLNAPVDLQVPDDQSGRMFVVEEAGTIRVVQNGALLTTAFLDIQSKVNYSGEMGLLGLAFHPNYAGNGKFYLNYNRLAGGQAQTVIVEYQVSPGNANLANPASERVLLTVDQPYTNHKGGQLAFGPDGYLYIGLGDGGSGGDPLGNGQSLQTWLGKMLRIDVDHTSPGLQYAIPADNPYAGGGGLPEIWAYGLRNPWRFSFERGGTRLFCADVGQDKYEEIDLVVKGGNFGWNTMEGSHCYSPASGCSSSGLILPIQEYDHSEGNAVIGGYVYKGSAIASLRNAYLFTDFSSGKIWSLKEGPGTWTRALVLSTGRNLSSFGQDAAGELYVVDYAGSILKLTAQ